MAQIVAVFLSKAPDQQLEHVRLLKYLYILDRRALELYGFPVSGDDYFAMPKGPILSSTLDLMRGRYAGAGVDNWSELIGDLENNVLRLKVEFDGSRLDQLSRADISLIDEVWSQYGLRSIWEIVKITHDNFPEWEDPGSSSTQIYINSIVKNLGLSPENQVDLIQSIEEQEALQEALARP